MSLNKKIMTNHSVHDTELRSILKIFRCANKIRWKIKILSSMTGYIQLKQINCEIIVTHPPLYEGLQYVLRESLSLSLSYTTTVLEFIAAILSIDDGNGLDGGSLKMHAQNALRVSGCLATLVDFFSRHMMCQDIWIALCWCVAEACRGSEPNQSYCSFLVPLCVRKCHQGNTEACAVLHSLLHNNHRNMNMFLDSDGASIFTGSALQFDSCLYLLDTVTQRSQRAATILVQTNLVNDLRECLEVYGPESTIGQWATIILHHIDSWCTFDEQKTNRSGKEHVSEINGNASVQNTYENDDSEAKDRTGKLRVDTHDKYNLAVTRDVLQNVVPVTAYRQLQTDNKDKTVRNCALKSFLTNVSRRDNPNDTDELMQKIVGELAYGNILNEIQVGNKQNIFETKMDYVPRPTSRPRNRDENTRLKITEPRLYEHSKSVMHGNLPLKKDLGKNTFISQNAPVTGRKNGRNTSESEDLSFSYLLNSERSANMPDTDNFVAKPTLTTGQFNQNYKKAKTSRNKTTSRTLHSVTNNTRTDDRSSTVNTRVFNPISTSTPKHKSEKSFFSPGSRISSKIQQSSRNYVERSNVPIASNLKRRRYLQPSATEKKLRKKSTASSVKTDVKKRQSMSARLFAAINESCTTFVKSVKGIFKVSKNNTKNYSGAENNNTLMSSLSFTNYMRKRDAAEANDGTKYGETEYNFSMDANSLIINSCKTCNETALLKKKIKSNENLRETIRKLKYGINLYGCDFKKISKALWPRDKFMTQTVLYNLYRKLLAK